MKPPIRTLLAGVALTAAGFAFIPTPGAETGPTTTAALQCDGTKTKKVTRKHDRNIRTSAQKGLDFLTRETLAWQESHNCMGCHVQGVTGEAMAVGRHHQYEVGDGEMKSVFSGILDLNGGLRHADSITHSEKGATLAFGGASVARYDLLVDTAYADDLVNAAQDLLEHQGEGGEIIEAANRGIAKGPLQVTYQAIQTWQQAYDRTADDRWLTAVAKGEAYLQRQVDAWYEAPPTDLQHVNYALLGLLAAGVGSSEKVATDLRDRLLEQQNKDGGFPLMTGGTSSPLTTGQTLYALRRLGMNDDDAPVSKATMYLFESQQSDGGWSDSGAEKAEAMWAVLGLVSTDVLSVNVAGIKNGQHVDGKVVLKATATDNEGSGVRKIEIAIDDEPVGGACTDVAEHTFDASKLSDGMHTIDITAYNAEGAEARRRFVVYAGEHYLTNVGTKFSDGGTLVSLRDIAPAGLKHSVELEVLRDGKKLHTLKQTGAQGPLSFHWKGEVEGSKKPAVRGEYVARLRFKDQAGKIRQTHDLPFVHDTPEVQANKYAQVSGSISFEDGDEVQNAVVELVDEKGNVVQSTRSTSSGNYRFRNVKSKKRYKVRVKKNGRATKEAPLAAPAEAAEEQKADFAL